MVMKRKQSQIPSEAAPQRGECKDLKVALGAAPIGRTGLAYRMLEKRKHPMINAQIQEKLDSLATSFAFQGFQSILERSIQLCGFCVADGA
jgi:hypothetical protein